jgi:hypothetical protein
MGIVLSPTRGIELAAADYQNNPFFAWENLGAAATLSGTDTVDGGERANAVTASTYDKWRVVEDGGEAVLSFDFGEAVNISFAAMVGHNLGTLGASVAVRNSADGITYADAGAGIVAASDNKPIAWRMSPLATARQYWQFHITGMATDAEANAAIAFLGHEIVLPSKIYQGFSPVLTPTDVQLQSNVSIGNELLGSSVIGRGATIEAGFTYIPASFIRSEQWLGFQAAFGEGKGFFFGWRPEKYPQDLYYCARSGDVIRPSNTGPTDKMNIQFKARVHGNG